MSEQVMDRLRRLTREVHGYPPLEAVGILAEDVEWLLSIADLAVDAADEAYREMSKGADDGFRFDFPATARLVAAMSRMKARHDRERAAREPLPVEAAR